MFWKKYPYTNFHELNLDWILARMMELHEEWDEFTAVNKITNAGAWDITKQYQAWTIVSDNNIGYISLQPVPAGVAISNTEYWGVIADYDILITDLSNRISDLENDVTTINTQISNLQANEVDRVVVIGDSWVSFDDRIAHPDRTQWLYDRMGANANIHNYAIGGTGASGMAAQLASAEADSAFDNNTVKKIVCVFGVNDYINGVPTADWISYVNGLYNTYIQVFPNAEFTILFDCMSPNAISGTHTDKGCCDYFRTVAKSVKIPVYFLGYYVIQPVDFESISGSSYHMSAEGGSILGRLFDQIVNGQTPNISRLVSQFAAGTDFIASKAFSGSTPTDVNLSALGVLQNVTGNNLQIVVEMSTSATVGCDTVALMQDLTAPAVYGKYGFIPSGKYKLVSARIQNTTNVPATALCEETLYTGTYQGVSLTNALMIHLASAAYVRTIVLEYVNIGI